MPGAEGNCGMHAHSPACSLSDVRCIDRSKVFASSEALTRVREEARNQVLQSSQTIIVETSKSSLAKKCGIKYPVLSPQRYK